MRERQWVAPGGGCERGCVCVGREWMDGVGCGGGGKELCLMREVVQVRLIVER